MGREFHAVCVSRIRWVDSESGRGPSWLISVHSALDFVALRRVRVSALTVGTATFSAREKIPARDEVPDEVRDEVKNKGAETGGRPSTKARHWLGTKSAL